MSGRIRARLVGNAIVVEDVDESRRLYKESFYGRFVGYSKVKIVEIDRIHSPLQLSAVEALYLYDKGVLTVVDSSGRELSRDELLSVCRSLIENFDMVYEIYRDLRDRNLVVKSGLKFGALFAVYERGPGIDHAPILVHFIEPNRSITALDITRAARLSHSVNKRFVLATWNSVSGKIDYIAFEWWTP